MPNVVLIFQFGVPTSQKECQFFKHSFYKMLREISILYIFLYFLYYTLLYKKFYILLDVLVTHIICICIVHKNCIKLHFYTSRHIKENSVELFFFSFLFPFYSLVRNENIKRPGFYALQVTRVFSNFPQLIQN